MSRMDGREAQVVCDHEGQPASLHVPGERSDWEVIRVVSHWREWLGALEGLPERDIWHILTTRGGCELHGLCTPGADEVSLNETHPPDAWILWRWDD